jgi:hypothetical protein
VKPLAIAFLATLLLAACASPLQTPETLASNQPSSLANESAVNCGSNSLPVLNQQIYQDVAGIWWMFGQVQNTTYQDVSLTRLCITYGHNGSVQVREWMLDTSMQSGETVPFRALLQDPSILANAHIVVTAQIDERVSGRATSYREFSQSDISVTPQNAHQMQFGGTIRNSGQSATRDVRIVVSIYDDANRLIGVADGRISSLGALNPGEETIFMANASQLFGTMARYTILVEGDVIDDSGETE